MALDRSLGQPEPAGDPSIGQPFGHQREHLLFAVGTPESRLAATSWATTSGFRAYENGHQEPDQP
jgi:hypothetical protein